jgi:CIC family chloride channel protein
MTITVAVSYAVRRFFTSESIYTMKLVRRGHRIPEALQASTHQLKRAGDIMDPLLMVLPANTILGEFSNIVSKHRAVSAFLVEDHDKRIIGVVPREAALRISEQGGAAATLGDLQAKDFVPVSVGATLPEILEKMRRANTSIAVVTDGQPLVSMKGVKGVITKQNIGEVMTECQDLFLD